MRIALLSNVTVEVLASMLGKEHDLWLAPGFGAWMETALGAPADLKSFNPEVLVLLLDTSHATCESASVETAVAALETAFPLATVLVPDLEDLAAEFAGKGDGQNPFFDERMWQLASMPWSLKGLCAIRDEIARLLRVLKGERRKVLALDFDNTLWKGVIGEDGVDGIEPSVDFQRQIQELRSRGVLLVGLSRNNAADVEPVWNDPRMILKRDDFADIRLGWNDKAANLTAAAEALNLGSDSFVFVDDNPVERARMAALHPEVTVVDWPMSARRMARLYFPKMRVTAEDRQKTALYRAEAKRRELAAALSVEDYLKSLAIRTEVHPIVESEFPRVAQLSQKSNQFNVCTNRLTVDDLIRIANDRSQLLVTLHASDRFGDQGLVAFAHVAGNEIVDFVMSCRAMNRRIEFVLFDWIAEALRRRGVTEVRATWRKTAKNAPVRDLFERFGFEVVHSTEEEKSYAKSLR